MTVLLKVELPFFCSGDELFPLGQGEVQPRSVWVLAVANGDTCRRLHHVDTVDAVAPSGPFTLDHGHLHACAGIARWLPFHIRLAHCSIISRNSSLSTVVIPAKSRTSASSTRSALTMLSLVTFIAALKSCSVTRSTIFM